METEALTIALQRGWDLHSLEPGACFLTDRLTRMKLGGKNTDSKIAEIMIKKNTGAMISSLKKLHQYEEQDAQLCILSQKILDSETAHIRQLETFL